MLPKQPRTAMRFSLFMYLWNFFTLYYAADWILLLHVADSNVGHPAVFISYCSLTNVILIQPLFLFFIDFCTIAEFVIFAWSAPISSSS